MTLQQLSKKLKENYENAYKGEFVAQIHLFGIEYGEIIKKNSINPKDIISNSGLNDSYLTELYKGIKLSNSVNLENSNLNSKDLGKILKDNFENADQGSAIESIFLFGIKYGKYIRLKNISLKEIIKESGLQSSYLTELNKGVKLSKFVSIKE